MAALLLAAVLTAMPALGQLRTQPPAPEPDLLQPVLRETLRWEPSAAQKTEYGRQQAYLLRLYGGGYIPEEERNQGWLNAVRPELLRNVRKTLPVWVDSITADGETHNVAGFYGMGDTVFFSRKYTGTTAALYLHELTHAAFQGDSLINGRSRELMRLCTDNRTSGLPGFRHVVSYSEIMARITTTRYRLVMYDFDKHGFISFREFRRRLKALGQLGPSDDTSELIMATKSLEHMYFLLVWCI